MAVELLDGSFIQARKQIRRTGQIFERNHRTTRRQAANLRTKGGDNHIRLVAGRDQRVEGATFRLFFNRNGYIGIGRHILVGQCTHCIDHRTAHHGDADRAGLGTGVGGGRFGSLGWRGRGRLVSNLGGRDSRRGRLIPAGAGREQCRD